MCYCSVCHYCLTILILVRPVDFEDWDIVNIQGAKTIIARFLSYLLWFRNRHLALVESLSWLGECYLRTHCIHFWPFWASRCLHQFWPGSRGTSKLNLWCQIGPLGEDLAPLTSAYIRSRGKEKTPDTFIWRHVLFVQCSLPKSEKTSCHLDCPFEQTSSQAATFGCTSWRFNCRIP